MMKQSVEKLERITIYLTKKEKRDAQIAAAQLGLNMATLGRQAMQYLIYVPEELTKIAKAMEANNAPPPETQLASNESGVD